MIKQQAQSQAVVVSWRIIKLRLEITDQNRYRQQLDIYKQYKQSMLNYFTSFGASSNFEKNRLIATTYLKKLSAFNSEILKTFQGEDEETRSQIAFATIVKKIISSDSNDSWIYLLKNLIIMDRVLQDMCFIQQIADLSLPNIEGYIERNAHYAPLRTADIVRNYWKLIKQTSKMIRTKKHILFFPRSQRAEFLQTLGAKQINRQIQTLQSIFKLCFILLNSIQSKENMDAATAKASANLQSSKLISYMKLQILYKLIGYYSSQMLCTNRFVTLLAKDKNMDMIEIDSIRVFKQSLLKFKTNSSLIIEFVERNKQIKGFEVINYRDFDPMPGNNILKSIDKCIAERLNFDDNTQNVQPYISSTPIKLRINPKASINQKSDMILQSRKKIQASVSKGSNTPFANWKSSYSQDFPQKQIMTIDLIMALKKQQQNERHSNYDDIISYNERETCVIANNQELPDHLLFKKPIVPEISAKYTNLYSGLQSVWNTD